MKFKKKMRPKWDNIHVVQDKLGKKLKGNEKGYIDSVKMVTGELLENAVKYYMKKGIRRGIDFRYSNKKSTVIYIKNQIIEDEDDLIPFIETVDGINLSSNPYNLFIERLQEILDNRVKGESRLGLLRIVSDGGFSLDYRYKGNRLSIYAVKSSYGDGVIMKPLEYGDLKIEVTEADGKVYVSWMGKCRTLNPEITLDSYLDEIVEITGEKDLVVSFEKLDSMNSSTVPPLLTFIKNIEDRKIRAEILYDESEDWQRASFKPLSVIASRFEFVVIRPV